MIRHFIRHSIRIAIPGPNLRLKPYEPSQKPSLFSSTVGDIDAPTQPGRVVGAARMFAFDDIDPQQL